MHQFFMFPLNVLLHTKLSDALASAYLMVELIFMQYLSIRYHYRLGLTANVKGLWLCCSSVQPCHPKPQ